jgi:hypothetical protein
VLLYLSVSRGTDDLEINRWGGLSGLCIVDIYLWSIYHRMTGIHHRNAGADTNIAGHGLVKTSVRYSCFLGNIVHLSASIKAYPSLMKLGVHPRKIHFRPSCFVISVSNRSSAARDNTFLPFCLSSAVSLIWNPTTYLALVHDCNFAHRCELESIGLTRRPRHPNLKHTVFFPDFAQGLRGLDLANGRHCLAALAIRAF